MPTMSIFDLLQQAVVHHQAGRLPQAETIYRQILQHEPNHADALHLLGVLAHQAGRSDLATTLIQRAVTLNPSAAIYHNNLGEAWRTLGRLDRAATCYQRATALKGDYAEAHMNLGTVHQAQGRLGQAIGHYRQAIVLNPNLADAHGNLGIALHEKGELDEAEKAQRRALQLNGASARAQSNLGVVLQELGRPAEARHAFERALELDGSYVAAHSNLLLCLHYDRGYEAETLFAEHQRWAQRHAEPLRSRWPVHAPGGAATRPLRIGYVSGDFWRHPVGFFMQPLLEAHDRTRFHITCYADVKRPDALTQRLFRHADNWRNIVGLSDEQLAEMIVDDGIDILVDLAGHTAGHRLLAFARKPAPVQVTYLGYPNTTGLAAMDYRFTDALADPPPCDAFHSERLVRLPECFLCYRPPDEAPAVADLPALQAGFVTFGSFNNYAKLTPPMLSLWARILAATPNSRLLLKSRALACPSASKRLKGFFAERGVSADRLELLGPETSYARHLETYSRLDIALDTFPYCGTTTTCEALWMGVPVVSLAGVTHVARVGLSLLSAAGLGDLVAATPEQYLALATALARDLPALAALRQRLRPQLLPSPLCDAQRLARSIEVAYVQMWQGRPAPAPPADAASSMG